jgi:hypothetical protein
MPQCNPCHCEERSDEAIQRRDCPVWIASLGSLPHARNDGIEHGFFPSNSRYIYGFRRYFASIEPEKSDKKTEKGEKTEKE